MTQPTSAKALRYHAYGDPRDTLVLEEIPLPILGDKDVLAEMIAAPINPADFGRINGSYGELATLPATGGNEGAARVISIGSKVADFIPGDLVHIPQHIGSWQEYFVAPEHALYKASEKLPVEIAAMSWINPPTAWLLLHHFESLQSGDWIIQNAATSAVGKLIIQFAKHLGLKTINLVRDLAAKSHLESLGGNIVILDDRNIYQALQRIGDPKPKLALNSIGGSSALSMAKCLADEGTLVTFGGMDRNPAPFPTRYLIFNDIRLRGFWLSKWFRNTQRKEIETLMREVADFMVKTKTKIDVASRFPLSDYRDALDHSQQPGKAGKILFIR